MTKTTAATPAEAASTGLDVVAIICAILIAPVGLVLGLVSRSAAVKRGLRPNKVTTAAIVIGAILTAIEALVILAPLIAVAGFLGTGGA